ncbi:MAG: glycoside hydrolase family 43 protein [Acidobacteriota bacterium]
MQVLNSSDGRETYLNPVYPDSFPDPYVLKHRGQYFGYCTGHGPDGRIFRIIRSNDLVNWSEVGGAMAPIADAPPFYWAPEVTYDNGKFYLYYSAGNETLMHLRVAVSDRPDGGFVDSERVLTTAEFAIDAHVFIDDDGSRYMFYATDFLEHTHIGTGTVVDKMVDWFQLEGDPQPVTRAKYDWQVYDPQRHEKGGVRWHTVEGPTVLKRKGIYFEMFSGGNWQNTTYGVSFASTDKIFGQEEWHQFSDGERVLPILRTLPGLVVGPGHNSVVRGPNNRELYCIYHCWTDAGRVLAIDRMDIAGDRLFVVGATYTPQIAPYQPSINDVSADATRSTGAWRQMENGVVGSTGESCERVYKTGESFLCEFTVRCSELDDASSRFGFRIAGNNGSELELSFWPQTRTAAIIVKDDGEVRNELELPADFDFGADHLIRVECSGTVVKTKVDASAFSAESSFHSRPISIAIYAENAAVEFAALSITEGFEEMFDTDFELSCWKTGGSHLATPEPHAGEVMISSDSECRLTHSQLFGDGEFAANIRLGEGASSEFAYGIELLDEADNVVARLGIRTGEAFLEAPAGETSLEVMDLGEFPAESYHQLRLVKFRGRLSTALDAAVLGDIECVLPITKVAVFSQRCSVFVEMVRATAI